MLYEYLPILIFLVLASIFATVMLSAGFIFGGSNPDEEKNSPYECGFEPFEDSRMKFDVRFYLVAFLFPWAVVLDHIGFEGFVAMAIFIFILLVGFIYEWKKGALEWD